MELFISALCRYAVNHNTVKFVETLHRDLELNINGQT